MKIECNFSAPENLVTDVFQTVKTEFPLVNPLVDAISFTAADDVTKEEKSDSNVVDAIESDDAAASADSTNYFNDSAPTKTAQKRMRNRQKPRDRRTPSTLNLTCDMCGKRFFKKHRLECHLRLHVGLKVVELFFFNI